MLYAIIGTKVMTEKNVWLKCSAETYLDGTYLLDMKMRGRCEANEGHIFCRGNLLDQVQNMRGNMRGKKSRI